MDWIIRLFSTTNFPNLSTYIFEFISYFAPADAQQVTVTAGGGAADMFIGALSDTTSPGSGNKWNAHVTILVLDEFGNPVANAQVTGSWSDGASGTSSCPTDSNGFCTVTKSNINGNRNSVTFTVDDVTHNNYTYNPSLNIETWIVVPRPI